jgi:LysM repeat protein
VIKKILILSIYVMSFNLEASSDIVLKDDSKGKMVQKNIIGCKENHTSSKQHKQDIAEIKLQLKSILAKLSAMEKETSGDIDVRDREISNIKDCINKLNKKTKQKYTIVKVKRGDRLSDYAKKYYGDKRKYYRIYRANRDKIGRDLELHIGDKIIIPLSKDYKYKKFKKIRRNTRKVKQNQKVVEPNIIEIIEPKVEYSRAKYISNNQEDTAVKMLDEIVYIDDETDKSDNKTLGLIPLDEN